MAEKFKPRSLPGVIDRIVARVPRLKEPLASIRESARFSPPECQREWWEALCWKLERMAFTAEEDNHVRAVLERNEP